MKNKYSLLGLLLLFSATSLVLWREKSGSNSQTAEVNLSSGDKRKTSTRGGHTEMAKEVGYEDRISNPLVIQPAQIAQGILDDDTESKPLRPLSKDDAILAAGGLADDVVKPSKPDQDSRKKRLESILAKDWSSSANLLVNELRAARGFSVPLEDVDAFLKGKELYGWPEGSRNWIGDEMMTMLRQEVPQKAYEMFSEIQADATAPEAMRDYSIQHISHLVADGAVGNEGVELIRAAFESGNPVLAGTALISLHRLSEKTPDLISAEDVREYATQNVDTKDERLQATARAILKEGM